VTEYFKIGKFITVHGLKGELLFKHTLGKKTSLKGLKAIFIEQKNSSFLPWFIETITIRDEENLYIRLEGINTRETALSLVKKEAWLPETDFKKFAAKSSPVNLLGYTIINNKEELGAIQEVIEQPHQLLCRIEIKNKEVLIPLNESTIKKYDHKNKKVIVELPEGLLDIYLT
jgi:16S rRNA processing protein RimM